MEWVTGRLYWSFGKCHARDHNLWLEHERGQLKGSLLTFALAEIKMSIYCISENSMERGE